VPQAQIDQLILNSPYDEPAEWWNTVTPAGSAKRLFQREKGRRPAGYVVASLPGRGFDDPGRRVEIPLVNSIRPRVKAWREAGWPGATGVTRRLLRHWTDPETFGSRRLFFCQLEAAETLIWLTEAPAAEKVGIDVPSDGGDFPRQCSKMATGSGKTLVMGMLIAWQVLNKVANPQDRRFSRHVLLVAPGVTVRSRLQVLKPSDPDNYYAAFDLVPAPQRERLRQGVVEVRNWQVLQWESADKVRRKRSVDKRGARSDAAWLRDVLGDMAKARRILVINDEAHHAWRLPAGTKIRGVSKGDVDEATKWVGGLDRIHRTRGILACYDFSATPFVPSGGQRDEEALFGWIVSDFGLDDAIESGLVKTPRVVVRDDALPDARTFKSRLYHLYNDPEVKDDLNRKAASTDPLPDLVLNAYHLLACDWREAARSWKANGEQVPPAMITVANRTETAARVKHAFDSRKVRVDELCDPERTLHIDSKVLAAAEAADEPVGATNGNLTAGKRQTVKERAERLRQQVNTVGRRGEAGGQIQNVISVGMLSEGWDAKTVTHIMGLRAFTSQLLCEQVVGRGLRRSAYDLDPGGLLRPEYVNVFGVPFSFLPHEAPGDTGPPLPPTPTTTVEPVPEKAHCEIRWPNLVRIEHVLRPRLELDIDDLEQLTLDASQTPMTADMAPIVEGKPHLAQVASVNLEKLAREYRLQRIAFETAGDIYEEFKAQWSGSREILLAQLVRLTERFVRSEKVAIAPDLFNADPLRRRLVIALNMTKVVRHFSHAIRFQNAETREPVFDWERPIRSTGDMATWFTAKPCAHTDRSHINVCVYDSTWEASEAFTLDHNPAVEAWVKNDHLGFHVSYLYQGVVRAYRPDFLVRLRSGGMLVLEVKGRERDRDRVKREALNEWIAAVNDHGGFGRWSSAVSRRPGEVHEILAAVEAAATGIQEPQREGAQSGAA